MRLALSVLGGQTPVQNRPSQFEDERTMRLHVPGGNRTDGVSRSARKTNGATPAVHCMMLLAASLKLRNTLRCFHEAQPAQPASPAQPPAQPSPPSPAHPSPAQQPSPARQPKPKPHRNRKEKQKSKPAQNSSHRPSFPKGESSTNPKAKGKIIFSPAFLPLCGT